MKAILAGLSLTLLASVAMAQDAVNPPAVNPPPALPDAGQNKAGLPEGAGQAGVQAMPGRQPDAGLNKAGVPDGAGQAGIQAMPGRQPDASADPDRYEGMIVQTPQGAYIVTEPDEGPYEPMPPAGMPPGGMQPPGDDGMMGRPPRGTMGRMGRPMPPSKAAHFDIRSGDMQVGVSCAQDEPMKNCIEAMSDLLDKIGTVQHH